MTDVANDAAQEIVSCLICQESSTAVDRVERFCDCNGGHAHGACLQRWHQTLHQAPITPHPFSLNTTEPQNFMPAHSVDLARRALALWFGWCKDSVNGSAKTASNTRARKIQCNLKCVHCQRQLACAKVETKVDMRVCTPLWKLCALAACRILTPSIVVLLIAWFCATKTLLASVPLPWVPIYWNLCLFFLQKPVQNAFAPPLAHIFDIQRPVPNKNICDCLWQNVALNLLIPPDSILFPELQLWSEYQRVYAPLLRVHGAKLAKKIDCESQVFFANKKIDMAVVLFVEFWALIMPDRVNFAQSDSALVYCIVFCSIEALNLLRYVFCRLLFTHWILPTFFRSDAPESCPRLHTMVLEPLR